MRKKKKRPCKQLFYEAGKRRLMLKGLEPKVYEQEIQKLASQLKI